jgi:hypothetical protein
LWRGSDGAVVKAFVMWWIVGFIGVTVLVGDALVGVGGGFLAWFLTVQVWPRTPCRRCGGSPRIFDWATTDNWRPCAGCSGRGWVPRVFAMRRE